MYNRSTTEVQVPSALCTRGFSPLAAFGGLSLRALSSIGQLKVLPDVAVAVCSCLTIKHKCTVWENLLFVGMCVRVHDNCERQRGGGGFSQPEPGPAGPPPAGPTRARAGG